VEETHHYNQRGWVHCYWDPQAYATHQKLSVPMIVEGKRWYNSNDTEHYNNW